MERERIHAHVRVSDEEEKEERSDAIKKIYMESRPSQPSTIYITCSTLESRALCAVCGAPAIGKNDE